MSIDQEVSAAISEPNFIATLQSYALMCDRTKDAADPDAQVRQEVR